MAQVISSIAQSPRMSANQLGEFVFASEKKRLSILHDQKFGNESAAPYYSLAHAAAHRSLSDGHFSASLLIHEADLIDQRPAETPRQAQKWANNALALRRLADVGNASDPPLGQHRTLMRNAHFVLDGVTISVLPDVVTENLHQGYIAFTKLRFSKSKIAADVSEIVLLVLQYYGQRQSRVGLDFNFELSKVIDCFSKTIIHGHAVGRHRNQQLHEALRLIRWLWPRIEPRD
jgi:hypothetical protein